MVEPSLVLYGAPYERAVEVLEETLRETGARYALLIDRKGFVLAHKEALWAPKPPPLDTLATLVASNAAATQALAKLLGEARFQEEVHQGERMGLYVDEAGEHALLVHRVPRHPRLTLHPQELAGVVVLILSPQPVIDRRHGPESIGLEIEPQKEQREPVVLLLE